MQSFGNVRIVYVYSAKFVPGVSAELWELIVEIRKARESPTELNKSPF